MKNQKEMAERDEKLYRSIRRVIEEGRAAVSRVANTAMVRTYWAVGKLIVEDEQHGARKAAYGKDTLGGLSARLTSEFGRGFAETNLKYMRQFYLAFPIRHSLRDELSWTHYRLLLRVEDPAAREWYANECVAQSWSSRALDRQIVTQSYGRLLAAANPDRRRKQEALPLSPIGDKPRSLVPGDFIRNPMMLEFLSLPADVRIRETRLESALISHLRDLLLELGRGFCFVGRQKRIRTETDDYFVDLVFYNAILKCYFLFDLKTSRITHQDVGQMDMYRRMFDEREKQPDDNPTVGIILCSETNGDIARYSILKGNEKLFAVKYKLYLPSEAVLRKEIEEQKEIYRLQMLDATDQEPLALSPGPMAPGTGAGNV